MLRLFLAAFYLLPFFAWDVMSNEKTSLEESNTETIAVYTEQVYPLNYTRDGNEDGVIVGVATELLIAIFNEANVNYEINMVPWSRAIHFLDSQKNVLVYSMNRTPARENLYHWIGEIYPVHVYIYGKRENQNQLPKTLKEAKSHSIGSARSGVVYDFLINNGFKDIKIVNSIDRYMPLIARDRFELFPFFDLFLVMSARRQNIDPDRFIKLMEIEELHTRLFFALSKSTSLEIVNKLKSAYQNIKDDGRYHTIVSQLVDNSVPYHYPSESEPK